MSKRVAITGIGAVTAFGESWQDIRTGLLSLKNAVRYMTEWDNIQGMLTRLGAPVDNFTLPDHYTRKKTRSMSDVSLYAVRASELALMQSGLNEDPCLVDGSTGVAFGSSSGGAQAIADIGSIITTHETSSISSSTYVKLMPHTTAVNVSLFFGIKGRLIPTSSACTSGSQAIGYAFESIRDGRQIAMVAGGAEEMSPGASAVFDTLYATSQKNDTPSLTPSPFDVNRDGLVIGAGAGALVLEEYEHAKARGAKILGEIVGFATNCDATHITQPNSTTIQYCIQSSLNDAGISPNDIGYICAHGTATTRGDEAESQATAAVFGNKTPFSSLKSYFGHTLGACGATEAYMSLMMMNEGWFVPTLNLNNIDPACGDLDYIVKEIRKIDTEFIQTNNFAFGGVNTSLLIRRG